MTDPRYAPGVLTGDVSPDGRDILLSAEGGDWQRKDIADALRHLTALPKTLKGKYDGQLHVPLTWAVVTQIARLAEQKGFKWRPEPDLNQWIVEEFTRRFTEDGDLEQDLSSLLRTPMPHQAAGAFVGAMNKRMFFADEMGSGKSSTALMTLRELSSRGENPFPAFIVCPAAVIDPWMEEIEEWGFDFKAVVYQGTKRRQLSTRYDIYVMSWDVFRRDMFPRDKARCPNGHDTELTRSVKKAIDASLISEGSQASPKCMCGEPLTIASTEKEELPPLLEFLVPKSIILDESHGLCNTKTRQSIAASRIAKVVDYAFLLSGTPITKNVAGFWRALSVLDIRSFPNQDRYKERYCDRRGGDYGPEEIEGLTTVNREEFYTLMQGTMRRVAKADIMKDLPPKRYSVRWVNLPQAYEKAYREMEDDMIAHLPDSDEPLPVMSTLAQLTRLSQLASSACDVKVEMRLDENKDSPTFGMEIPHYAVTMKEPSWKIDELVRLLEEMEGSPLVCFSPSTQLAKLAGARAEKEGYKVGYIVGGQSKDVRTRTRKAFQNGELDIICANTAAGGVGLTLTAADTLVFLNRPWSYVQSAQSEDRIHRRGQTKQAHIIDIVARDTVEERVRTALRDKAQQLSDLVRDKRIVSEILGGNK